MIMIYMR